MQDDPLVSFRCDLQVLVDELLQLALRHRADGSVHELPVLEHHERGDRRHPEPLCDLRVLVDVHLRDDRLALIRRSKLFDDRADDPARTAPRRPEVDENRLPGLHCRLERCVGYVLHCGACLCHLDSLLAMGSMKRGKTKFHVSSITTKGYSFFRATRGLSTSSRRTSDAGRSRRSLAAVASAFRMTRRTFSPASFFICSSE